MWAGGIMHADTAKLRPCQTLPPYFAEQSVSTLFISIFYHRTRMPPWIRQIRGIFFLRLIVEPCVLSRLGSMSPDDLFSTYASSAFLFCQNGRYNSLKVELSEQLPYTTISTGRRLIFLQLQDPLRQISKMVAIELGSSASHTWITASWWRLPEGAAEGSERATAEWKMKGLLAQPQQSHFHHFQHDSRWNVAVTVDKCTFCLDLAYSSQVWLTLYGLYWTSLTWLMNCCCTEIVIVAAFCISIPMKFANVA